MRFSVQIEGVRPITALTFEINLDHHGLLCIVGKNSAGKTTLAKAIMNFSLSDTFIRTSSAGIFDSSSNIRYKVDEDEYLFTYDAALRSLSTKKPVPANLKKLIAVEMSAPHGQRFTFFRTLANADDDIRRAIVLGQCQKPVELIEFLSSIYGERRFDDLQQVQFSGGVCCCIVQPDKRYIREDYFSSGEYFLINLYRKVLKRTSLVVIDEIDIALDANAQAQLAVQLRLLCEKHRVTVVFTSHSLALMQTLKPVELHYLDRTEAKTFLTPMSFNAVKSLMFGFKGWDRYILTEDDVLEEFLRYVIAHHCSPAFFSYQIIQMGGGGQATGLMKKNIAYEFLGPKAHVMSILDGDQQIHNHPPGVFCIPLSNVEQALWEEYRQPGFSYTFDGGDVLAPKPLYWKFISSKKLLREEIFKLLCDRHNVELQQFAQVLTGFLGRPNQ